MQEAKIIYWALAGVILGLAVGVSQLIWRSDIGHGVGRVLSQSEFERRIRIVTTDGSAQMQLLIHPQDTDGRVWVTGTSLANGQAESFRFAATVPYRPVGEVNGDQTNGLQVPTLQAYLRQLKMQEPKAGLEYRHAWWKQTHYALALWAFGGLLVGTAWPILLRIVTGGDVGSRQSEPSYDVAPFGSLPDRSIAGLSNKQPGAAEELDAYVGAMVQSHVANADVVAEASESIGRNTSAPIEILSTFPLQPQIAPTPEPQKDYRGEFYPVVVPASSPPSSRTQEPRQTTATPPDM